MGEEDIDIDEIRANNQMSNMCSHLFGALFPGATLTPGNIYASCIYYVDKEGNLCVKEKK